MKRFFLSLIMTFPVFAAPNGFKDCYAITKPLYAIQIEAIKACAPAGPEFKACYEIAKSVFTIHAEAIRACVNAGPGFEDCYKEANC